MVERHLTIEPAPEGWTDLQLADMCDRVQASVQPVEGGRTPYVGLEHLASGAPVILGHGVDGDVTSSKAGFSAGDVLFGKLRPYLRKGAQPDFDGVCSTDILVFRAKQPGTPEYLKYLVHSDEFIEHAKATTSGVQHPRTSWSSLREFKLTLPPSHEQQRIAQVLSTVQQAIEQQERLIRTTTELKQALMQKLFTEGLRGEAQKVTEIGLVPESWEVVKLGSLAHIGNGSTPRRTTYEYWNGGTIPWLNSSKIHEVFITEADQFVTDMAVKECHLPKVPVDSLLIAITGQGKTLGNVAITKIETCINQHLAYVRFTGETVVPEYLLWYLSTRYEFLRSIANGAGSTKGAITCGYLKTLPVPVPAREEQEEIRIAFNRIEQKLTNARSKVSALNDLFRTLLHELMTGKVRVGSELEPVHQ